MGLKTTETETFLKHIRGGHDRVLVEGKLYYNSITGGFVWANKFLEKCEPEKCDIEPSRHFEESEIEALIECYTRIKTSYEKGAIAAAEGGRMTENEYSDALLLAGRSLIAGEIDLERFEDLCKRAWVDLNGPVPDGHELVVGLIDDRIAVGHRKKDVYPEFSCAFPYL